MENFLTKNVLISILVGILVITGAFLSRTNNKTKTDERVSDIDEKNTASVIYQKQKDKKINLATSGTEEKIDSLKDIIKIQDLPSIETKNLGDKTINFVLTPSASTLSYEEIIDKKELYGDGIERYKPANFKTTDTNRASLITYGNNLNKITRTYLRQSDKNPLEIVLELSEKYDEDKLITLEEIFISYSQAIKELSKISVPKNLLNYHTDLTNSLDRSSQLLKNMEKVGEDRLLALNSGRQLIAESEISTAILNEMNDYYTKSNITLQDETGDINDVKNN